MGTRIARISHNRNRVCVCAALHTQAHRAELETLKDALQSQGIEHTVDAIWLCPISHEIMAQPVLASDGHMYERASISEWFSRGQTSSPLTNQVRARHWLVSIDGSLSS